MSQRDISAIVMSRRDNNVERAKLGCPMAKSNHPAKVPTGRAGDSPAYWYRGVLWDVLLSADQTLGEFTFLEQVIPAGAGPPAHIHERQAEGFYLLSGEVEFVVGNDDEVLRAEPGSAVWVPKSTRHAFRVVSEEDARVLNFYTQAVSTTTFRFSASRRLPRRFPLQILGCRCWTGSVRAPRRRGGRPIFNGWPTSPREPGTSRCPTPIRIYALALTRRGQCDVPIRSNSR